MDAPFFNNRRWYQQPEPTRRPFSRSPSFPADPFFEFDSTPKTQNPPPAKKWGPKVVKIPVHFVGSKPVDRSGSALKIQKVFRGFLVRKWMKKIKDIKVQVDEIEERLSMSEVVELIRREEKERLRMSETLMSLLLKLDSICGVDLGVRACRKGVIRKAIALQERIDAIVESNLGGNGENDESIVQEIDSEETNSSNKSDSIENSGDLEDCIENQGGGMIMEVEGNDVDGDVEIIDVGVDKEVKVSEVPNGVHGDLDLIQESDDEKIMSEKDKGGDESGKNGELLERMMKDNEKMMKLMTELCERNELQTRTINALTKRVDLLEKAFVCDMLMKKKKKNKNKKACTQDSDVSSL